jgi:septal ring factor EnvC (AmiA/AmiB activator)
MHPLPPLLFLTLVAAAPPPIGEAARQRLEAAQAEARASAAQGKRLAERSQAESARARTAAASLVRLAARVQADERQLLAVERRLAALDRARRIARDRLAARQAKVLPLVAALETMARRPAALALLQPGSAADLAHVRIALGGALPTLEARTAALRREVGAADRLVAELRATRDRRRALLSRLQSDRAQLARVEATSRAAGSRLALGAQGAARRAVALAADARSLRDLLVRLSRGAGDAGPPALRLRPRVVGEVTTRFGRAAESGLHAQGMTIASVAGAQVIAPAAGRVAFAGPFRTYGRIVIIEHGGKWLTLLAGLDDVAARTGDIVPAGLPVGRLAADDPSLYLELRQQGAPVDPEPLLDPQAPGAAE